MNESKILLIGPSPLGEAPYVYSYIEIFEKNGIPFDLVYWNRHIDDVSQNPSNFIPYNKFTHNRYPFWKKFFKIHGFYRFVRNLLLQNEYAYVVVFTIANAVYFDSLFSRRYKGRFFFDIRDYSPMCRFSYFRKKVNSLIKNSAFTVVSSIGFLKWLPSCSVNKYLVSHNTNINILDSHIHSQVTFCPSMPIRILTIGQLRDFVSNSRMITHLENNPKYHLIFAGDGLALEDLTNFSNERKANNVMFLGRYKKEEETSIVQKSNMINIFFCRDINSDTLMSNRFYLSVLFRKPMIVNEGCFQAEMVRKYGLGVAIGKDLDFNSAIQKYWQSFDPEQYDANCIHFLNDVRNDICHFEEVLVSLYNVTTK